MQRYKIVFSGPMGAGKTQAIRSLSEVTVVSTEAANTDIERHSKELTTVGMDYGEINIGNDLKIGLYGTPGQDRFDFIWPILVKGALGVVLIIDHSSPKAVAELEHYLSTFKKMYSGNMVIGISHVDENPDVSLSIYDHLLSQHQPLIPVFPVDLRVKQDVLLLVEVIIARLEADQSLPQQETM
ncbi:MAG: ATP/GTP-binding protein [Pseudomonadota bacterium]|nr:ATP/GTP-binding protein [Pseudomonadota bacterium]